MAGVPVLTTFLPGRPSLSPMWENFTSTRWEKNSIKMWPADPMPGLANVNIPGFALAAATKSSRLFSGELAGTTVMLGTVTMLVMGAKSLIGS